MTLSSHAREMPWTRHLASKMMRAMEDYRAGVGARLLALRKSRNLSQEDAAHLVGVGVKTWHNWESGKRSPYESNWRRIAEAFEIDVQPIRGTPPAPLGLDLPEDNGDIAAQLQEIRSELAELREQHAQLLALFTREPNAAATLSDAIAAAIEDALSQRAEKAGLQGRRRPLRPPREDERPAA